MMAYGRDCHYLGGDFDEHEEYSEHKQVVDDAECSDDDVDDSERDVADVRQIQLEIVVVVVVRRRRRDVVPDVRR